MYPQSTATEAVLWLLLQACQLDFEGNACFRSWLCRHFEDLPVHDYRYCFREPTDIASFDKNKEFLSQLLLSPSNTISATALVVAATSTNNPRGSVIAGFDRGAETKPFIAGRRRPVLYSFAFLEGDLSLTSPKKLSSGYFVKALIRFDEVRR